MRFAVFLAALLALAGCERAKKPEPAEPAPAIEVREVAAADAYAEAGTRVNAVALWSHPRINFQGLVVASTPAGLKSFDIESGALVSEAGDVGEPGGLSIVYFDGTPAQGYVLAASGQGYVARAIDNETRAFSPVNIEMGAPGTGEFCAGRRGAGRALYEISETGLALRQIDFVDGRLLIGDPQPLSATRGVAFCLVDDRNGAVVTISADGAVRRLGPETGESFGLALIEGLIADSTALLMSTDAGDEPKSGGAVAILDGKAGVVRLIDLADGHALGFVRIRSTFDLKAIDAATAIALGSGNYGGVYRDGVLAVVSSTGDHAPIRLVPWNGVLSALQLPLGETVDPRAPSPVAEDESVIDIEFFEP